LVPTELHQIKDHACYVAVVSHKYCVLAETKKKVLSHIDRLLSKSNEGKKESEKINYSRDGREYQ
jgi:hypothetical protein